jgi:hypothetical protein
MYMGNVDIWEVPSRNSEKDIHSEESPYVLPARSLVVSTAASSKYLQSISMCPPSCRRTRCHYHLLPNTQYGP